jgi:hypothetical protein
MFRQSIDLCYVGLGQDDDYGLGRVIAKVISSVCMCVYVYVSMYSCSTFKLFDEKISCLHRAEYESLYKRTDAKENIIFVRKVFESVSVLWVFMYSRVLFIEQTFRF